MILYDISMTIAPDMAVYKKRSEKKPRLTVTRNFSNNTAYETRLEMDMHTGTHIDMPLHMLPDGNSSDQWSADNIFTRCMVFDLTDLKSDRITAHDLQKKEDELQASAPILVPGRTVLLKTVNSLQEGFDFNFTFLEKSGAGYLAEKGFCGVGIDALGIERDQPGHDTHRILLEAGVWILEGLRLGEIPQGLYTLVVMPLKIKAVEALPARAVLLAPDSITLP